MESCGESGSPASLIPDLYLLLYITYPIISGNDLAEQLGGNDLAEQLGGNDLAEQLGDISTEEEVTCIGGGETLPKQVI